MIYFIHGPDRLLAREAVAGIAFDLDPHGFNTSHFDGRESPVEQIIAAVGSASFFGSPRVVIVSNLLAKGSGDATAEADDESAESPGRSKSTVALGSLLASVPDQNCLILHEPALSAAPAGLKSAAAGVRIVAGEPPRGAALVAWIIEAAARAGADIDRRTAHLLAETLYPQTWDRKPSNPRYDRPPDLALMTMEIEKLALAAHPGSIQPEHVLSLVPGGADQRLFRFIDAVLAGDLRQALIESDKLAAAGEEPAMLLAQILGQAELAVIAAAAGTKDGAAVARDLGSVPAGRLSAVMSSLRGRRNRDAGTTVHIGALADRRLKTGRTRRPETALHDLIVDLAVPPRT